jgi:N-methylhydantoinase A
MALRVGIDTGGTFTDVVAVDEDSGEIITAKTPSTPEDPAEGFMAALGRVGASGIAAVCLGTTVATNQLLEGRAGDLGFVTTEGFEFLLEIARQSVPDGYGNSYFWVKPPRIVPVHRVRTVGGRLDHTGAEVRPFDREAAVRAARWFHTAGIGAIGVCFLHSYANPAHELAMRDVLRREHPEAVVSLSHEVLREYREYERSVTTLVDAAVKPTVGRYVARLADRLGDVPLYVMTSNGGVLAAAEVGHRPVTTVLSGPAAGALGAAFVARDAFENRDMITLDGGGTSTDVAVVVDGAPTLTTEGAVGRYPCKIPMIDIVTVGAGGGSIAWISPEGTLKVGPRSAGADPGPLCYGRGAPASSRPADPGRPPGPDADRPSGVTVTDAHAYLGRIPPHLLGGEIALDVRAARDGLRDLASGLGLGMEACATGVLEVSAWNQANAIRRITVERGLDVRDLPMVAFGGSGPLLACRLIDILGLPFVVVPRDPANLSAFGLLTVDVRADYVRTFVTRDPDPGTLGEVYGELERQAAAALDRQGFAEHRYLRSADLRYHGQAFEVRVPVGRLDVEEVAGRFHDAHERLYGYCHRDDPVEWVNLRVSGIGPIRRPELPEVPPGDGDPARARTGTRRVFFERWAGIACYARERLRPGDVLEGPAVIEEFGSTLPLHDGFATRMDRRGNLIVGRT